MSGLQIIHSVVMGLVFLIWAFFMFRMLWALTRRSLDKQAKTGGGYFTWAGHSLGTFTDAATSDKDKKPRRKLILLTVLLMVLVGLSPVIAPIGQ